jgi:nucleoside-diphosphate-sugar epimerase
VETPVTDSVVTGAAGFIGSQLVESLLERGDRVVGIDSFDPFYSARIKRENLETARRHPRYRFIESDLLRYRLDRQFSDSPVVYHMAAQAGVRGSWGTRFSRYARNNLLATQAVFEASVRSHRPSRVVYASSSSVYGDQPPGASAEDALPNPVSPYGVTKLAAEHLGRTYAKSYGLPVTALRFFTVYGPRQRPDMAFNRFIDAIRHDRAIEVYGRARQLRDFTFVSDIVAGLVAAGEVRTPAPVYNLGGGSPVILAEALRLLSDVSGRSLKMRQFPLPPGDAKATWADIRLARRELGFRPRVKLRKGLAAQWTAQTGLPAH